jgi:ABC-type proline/glycine betaine transport system substrate-binding protein
MDLKSKTLPSLAALTAVASLSFASAAAYAQEKTITLCWAAWDPANAIEGLHDQEWSENEVRVCTMAELC